MKIPADGWEEEEEEATSHRESGSIIPASNLFVSDKRRRGGEVSLPPDQPWTVFSSRFVIRETLPIRHFKTLATGSSPMDPKRQEPHSDGPFSGV